MRTGRGRPRRAKKRPKCKGTKVWGYPADAKLHDPRIEFAWACGCGGHGASYPDRPAAEKAAEDHLSP